jgi:hypothetical protein
MTGGDWPETNAAHTTPASVNSARSAEWMLTVMPFDGHR